MSQAAVKPEDAGAFDPYSIPLEEIDMAQPHLFQNQQHWGLFERLRKEDPVHYAVNEEFGPY